MLLPLYHLQIQKEGYGLLPCDDLSTFAPPLSRIRSSSLLMSIFVRQLSQRRPGSQKMNTSAPLPYQKVRY